MSGVLEHQARALAFLTRSLDREACESRIDRSRHVPRSCHLDRQRFAALLPGQAGFPCGFAPPVPDAVTRHGSSLIDRQPLLRRFALFNSSVHPSPAVEHRRAGRGNAGPPGSQPKEHSQQNADSGNLRYRDGYPRRRSPATASRQRSFLPCDSTTFFYHTTANPPSAGTPPTRPLPRQATDGIGLFPNTRLTMVPAP